MQFVAIAGISLAFLIPIQRLSCYLAVAAGLLMTLGELQNNSRRSLAIGFAAMISVNTAIALLIIWLTSQVMEMF